MANYTIYGTVKDANCNVIKNAKVYPYFKKVDSNSPDSKWSDQPYTTDDFGYYSVNLGDNVLLGSEAGFKKGTDKIYLAIVYNSGDVNDQTMESLTFTDALFIEHVTILEDSVEVNLNISPKRLPVVTAHTFPDAALLTRHNYTMDEDSYSDYTWTTNGCYDVSTSQKLTYDLVDIFDGHILTTTLYDWAEPAVRTVANNSSDVYQYDIAGVYDISITVRELWNTEVVLTKTVTVKYNLPVPEFNWTPTETNNWAGSKLKGQELITFHNLSSDIDNRTYDSTKWGTETYTYKWTITDALQDGTDNTKVYDNKDYAYEPTHAFQSAGVKTITLLMYWNDGFDDHTVEVSRTITIHAFDIIPDFNWDILNPTRRNQDITFNPDLTTGDTDVISRYDWDMEDSYPASETNLYTFKDTDTSIFSEGSSDNTVVVDNSYDIDNTQYPVVKFHSVIPKNITLTIYYSDGWKTVTETITKTLTPVKYIVTPDFSISDSTPMGRNVNVIFDNTTSYIRDTFHLAYTIDWELEDSYSTCNLDNPDSGNIHDNSDSLYDQVHDTTLTHYFQSTLNHNVVLTIRYDDGWQMQTKTLTKTVTPEVFPDPVLKFTWDPVNPKGRDVITTITNDTVYDNTRCRDLDWFIEDSYSACNLDNPDSGNVHDNSVSYIRVLPTYQPEHLFQSPIAHDIKMIYYYDDGYCERSLELTKQITPIVYANPTPSFTWDITVPTSRDQTVVFSNTTTDVDNRFRAYDWTIPDSYNLFNPDNVDYGNNVVDNTQTILYNTDKLLTVSQNFQDNISRIITMRYYFDDGYCERAVLVTNTITFTEYSIVPDLDTNIDPVNDGFVGKIEVGYFNTSTGDTDRMLDEKWVWNDKVFPNNTDNFITRDDQVVSAVQLYTFQTPSRKPYTAIDNDTTANVNKDVMLEVRIDTGWRDDALNDSDNTTGDGGQVYFTTSYSYEATPYELSSVITYECNNQNYTH